MLTIPNDTGRDRAALLLGALLAASLSLASWYFFYIRYFAWRDCFNELGRCYDPDGTRQVYTTAGITWALPGGFFFLVAVALFKISSRHSIENRAVGPEDQADDDAGADAGVRRLDQHLECHDQAGQQDEPHPDYDQQ